jgi:hypothetical protein
MKISTTFPIYATIFSLTQLGRDNLWPRLSYVGGQQKIISPSRQQPPVWIDKIGDTIAQLI